MDNWYTSISLAEELLYHNTTCTGTIRKNRRGLPDEVIKTKLKRGQAIGLENKSGVQVVKWHDKRDVLTISTDPSHSEKLTPTGKIQRNGEQVLKPQSVIDYNHSKQGVDLSDQFNSYYSPLRKGSKWWRKLAFEFLLGTSISNSWVLDNKYFNTYKKMSILEFRNSIQYTLDSPNLANPNPR